MQLLELLLSTNMTACKEHVSLLAPICFTWSLISDSNGDKTVQCCAIAWSFKTSVIYNRHSSLNQ